jgi:ketosteroid isomerase-like protein
MAAAEGEIRRVIERYFYGIDSGKAAVVLSAFSDDARYEFAVEEIVLKGRVELSGFFGRNRRPGEQAQRSCHTAASGMIEVRGDIAFADTFATAHLVDGIAGEGRALIRGIRYLDQLRRETSGWLICSRRHHSLWQYEAPCSSPDLSEMLAGPARLAQDILGYDNGDENGR